MIELIYIFSYLEAYLVQKIYWLSNQVLPIPPDYNWSKIGTLTEIIPYAPVIFSIIIKLFLTALIKGTPKCYEPTSQTWNNFRLFSQVTIRNNSTVATSNNDIKSISFFTFTFNSLLQGPFSPKPSPLKPPPYVLRKKEY